MKLEPVIQLAYTAFPVRRRKREGQAILLVLVAMGLLLMGAMGLAIDGAQMYAQRQMAQTAADAAAQAAMLSIFDGTNSTETTTFATGSPAASITCSTTNSSTPCAFAHNNGFNTSSDAVQVDFNPTVPVPSGVTLSSDPVNLTRVTITRTLSTTLLRFLGPATSTISATATAAIVTAVSNVPIVITHPTLGSSLQNGGASSITILGGPQRSIQVNSSSASAFSVRNIDLSGAGPNGTGGDFAVTGGPHGTPGGVNFGTTGHWINPASPILDPLGPQGANVAAPAVPAAAAAKTGLANGVGGCPASPKKGCNLYYPGLYSGSTGISIKNETAVLSPGIYYLSGTGGFSNAANGDIVMATGRTDGPSGTNTGWTGNVLIYLTGGGNIDIGANSDATLVGSPANSAYKGILFFMDHNAAANTHNMGGGGNIALTGTIYLNNFLTIVKANSAHYQSLNLGGGSGSATVTGEIIVDTLSLGGNSSITMNLDSTTTYTIRQVALVN